MSLVNINQKVKDRVVFPFTTIRDKSYNHLWNALPEIHTHTHTHIYKLIITMRKGKIPTSRPFTRDDIKMASNHRRKVIQYH